MRVGSCASGRSCCSCDNIHRGSGLLGCIYHCLLGLSSQGANQRAAPAQLLHLCCPPGLPPSSGLSRDRKLGITTQEREEEKQTQFQSTTSLLYLNPRTKPALRTAALHLAVVRNRKRSLVGDTGGGGGEGGVCVTSTAPLGHG